MTAFTRLVHPPSRLLSAPANHALQAEAPGAREHEDPSPAVSIPPADRRSSAPETDCDVRDASRRNHRAAISTTAAYSDATAISTSVTVAEEDCDGTRGGYDGKDH